MPKTKREYKITRPRHQGMDRLKQLWLAMPEDQRLRWRVRLDLGEPLDVIRAKMATELDVHLGNHSQICAFKKWLASQDAREQEARQWELGIGELVAKGMTLDEAHHKLLSDGTIHILKKRDYKLGASYSSRITRYRALELTREKFEFDATTACLAKLPELTAIQRDTSLTEYEKLRRARLQLFGEAPA